MNIFYLIFFYSFLCKRRENWHCESCVVTRLMETWRKLEGEKNLHFFGKTLIIEIYERAILYLKFSLDAKWIFFELMWEG